MSYNPRYHRPPMNRRFLAVMTVLLFALISYLTIQIWIQSRDARVVLVFLTVCLLIYAVLFRNDIKPRRFRKKQRVPSFIQMDLQKWWADETISIALNNLTPEQIDKLSEEVLRLFGTMQISRQTLPKVGLIAKAVTLEDRNHFNVLLYRRDLAAQRGIKRPWKTHTCSA